MADSVCLQSSVRKLMLYLSFLQLGRDQLTVDQAIMSPGDAIRELSSNEKEE